ncbi:MAG: biopolymer transporter ExbD [Myxococcales bacterium]|nr:biopolymer transporter ExbD [Myxococcales bacterium]MCB9752267.1 biopolymer transporter ExbD [Myxococcales bacterium]
MAASYDNDDEEITSINVTPLVDVMLVLLIIFMVTTTTIQASEAMNINKPDANTGQTMETNPNQIFLQCAKDGSVFVDRQKIAPADVDKTIKDAIAVKLSDNQELQGVIQCDEEAPVGAMIHLMDLLRESGVKKYAVATEKPKPTDGASAGG